MTTSRADLHALRRGSQPEEQTERVLLPHTGDSAAVPLPRARWATRWLVPMVVILVTGVILAYSARDALQPGLAVHVAPAIPKAIPTSAPATDEPVNSKGAIDADAAAPLGHVVVQAPGWVEPAPFAVSIPALADGVVREVLVLEGETITAGQVVVKLIDADAKLALRAAEAMVSERSANVERARAAVATVESQVQVERIAADVLRDEVTHKREIAGVGGVSTGEFRRMEIRLSGLEAKVVTAENMTKEARAGLLQAETALASAHVGMEEAALRLSRMEVRAPVGGVVMASLVEPGSRISSNSMSGEEGSMSSAVLRIYDPAKLQVRVDVPLADAGKVGIGTRAVVTTEALPDQSFTGVVSRVVHEANIQRNTVQFKLALDAPSPALKPEMLTRVKLHAVGGGTNQSAAAARESPDGSLEASTISLLVPTSAVTKSDEGKGSVWVVDIASGVPVARLRDLTIESSLEEGFTAVRSGLRLTDRVIIDAPAPPAIRDGVRLRILGEQLTDSTLTTPTP